MSDAARFPEAHGLAPLGLGADPDSGPGIDADAGRIAPRGIVNLSGRGMLLVSVARQLGSGNSFARLLCCPAQAKRAGKRRPRSAKLTMRAPGDRQGVRSASLFQ